MDCRANIRHSYRPLYRIHMAGRACMHKRVENVSEREGAAEVAAITLCSLGYANGLMRNNNKKRSNELAACVPVYKPTSVYFRQPTKRGEKAAANGGGSPRVEPTAQGEGPEEEVNRASGQGEPGALTHRYRSRREDFFFVVFPPITTALSFPPITAPASRSP